MTAIVGSSTSSSERLLIDVRTEGDTTVMVVPDELSHCECWSSRACARLRKWLAVSTQESSLRSDTRKRDCMVCAGF